MPRTIHGHEPPPAPPEAAARFRQLIEQATATWRGWALAMAAGEPGPPPLRLLEVGALLELRAPGEVLDEDVAAIHHDARLHDAIRRHRAERPRIWPPEDPNQ